MKLSMDFTQALIGDVGVNLCGSDGGVAEERLDAADICAIAEQVCGIAVPERVRTDLAHDAGNEGIFFYHALDAARGQT